jgi:hypothetical protein
MYRLLISIVAVLAAFVGAAQATTILQNGGFEDGFNGWTQLNGNTGVWAWNDGTATINTTDAYEGLASADFYTAGNWSGGAGVFQAKLMGAGVNVSISAYAKGAGGGGSGIDMVFFDVIPSEAVQDPPNIGRVDLSLGNFGPANASGWRYGLLSAVTPANTVCMKFEVNNNGGTGHLLYDDVVGIPEPATIALLGLGGLALIRRKR